MVSDKIIEVDSKVKSISVKESFESSEPSECPIKKWKIVKTVNKKTNLTEFDEIVKINDFGLIAVLIEKPEEDYLVYVSASHGFSLINPIFS